MLEALRRKSLSYSYINLINKIHIEKGHAIYLNAYSIAEHKQRLSKKKTKKTFASTFDGVSKKFRNISNTLSRVVFNMILCPAGTFTMGHENQEDNQPRPEIIERSFLLGETEVTQELYQVVMGTNPSEFRNKQSPVETVSWFESILFCNELSKLQGLDECYTLTDISTRTYTIAHKTILSAKVTCDFSKNGYRLPTEKEWEYAAKAGTNNRWAGTDNENDVNLYVFLDYGQYDEDEDGNEGENTEGNTGSVKSKSPNAWGLYDMSGNVWEWCWDKYDPQDPSILAKRVNRGGCFQSDISGLRSDKRDSNLPGWSYASLGFRVCRSVVN